MVNRRVAFLLCAALAVAVILIVFWHYILDVIVLGIVWRMCWHALVPRSHRSRRARGHVIAETRKWIDTGALVAIARWVRPAKREPVVTQPQPVYGYGRGQVASDAAEWDDPGFPFNG